MTQISNRAIGEIVAIVSVVLSLLFVGLEFRQSTIASRASAYQELGITTADMLFKLSENPRLVANYQSIGDGEKSLNNLNPDEQTEASLFLSGMLRLYETVFLQVELGLLEAEALDFLGWENFRNATYLKVLWPVQRGSLSESFVDYMELSWEQD